MESKIREQIVGKRKLLKRNRRTVKPAPFPLQTERLGTVLISLRFALTDRLFPVASYIFRLGGSTVLYTASFKGFSFSSLMAGRLR